MGVLFRAVNLSNELKKQIMIEELKNMGIFDSNGQSLEELSYYEVLRILAAAKVKIESPENEWF